MTLTHKTILRLLALALGHDVPFDIPLREVDWPALIQYAMAQGLDAMTFDGIQALYERQPELTSELDESLGETKFDWLGLTLQAEQDYERQWKSFVELDKAFRAEGIRMLVLKGFMFNECYPDPRHRSSCDIDCFLMREGPMMDDGAYERGNQLMESRGIAVDRSYYKNSSFSCFLFLCCLPLLTGRAIGAILLPDIFSRQKGNRIHEQTETGEKKRCPQKKEAAI